MTNSETVKKSTDADMDQKENLVDKELTLGVVLPGGVEKTATVHGSKPVMDLLVILCAKYRLNPSSHTIELSSPNGDCIKCKPHALIGALEVEKILIKPKGVADKKQGPKMPEATVRLVINYKKTHKTVLRVSPRIPLGEHMPAVCAKCELDLHTAVLLRNASSKEPLELTKSLDDLGLREVYAVDEKENKTQPGKDKVLKEKENKGLFSIFKRSKKKPEQVVSDSAPASPVLKDSTDGVPSLSAQAPTCSPNATLSDVPKKRRAPLPPMTASQSAPSNLSDQQPDPQPNPKPDGPQEESGIGRGSLKSSKRKAPPPPSAPCIKTIEGKTEDKSIKVSHLKEISEQEEVVSSVDMDTSTCDARQETNSSLSLSTASSVDCGKTDVISPPVDIETRETSPSEVMREDPQQSDLASDDKPAMNMDPDPMKEVTEEIMNAEEPSTSEMEDRGLTSDSASSEVESQPGESALAPTEESLTLQCQSEPDSSPVSVEEAELQTVPPSGPRRQYTPRPGRTTYTIVPSKSGDKLKYFEVELTLVDPAAAVEEDRAAMEEERTALEEDRAAMEEDRTALDEDRAAMVEERTALEEDRTALEENTSAMEEDRTAMEEDRTALEEDRTALEEDRTVIEEDRTALEEERTALEEDRAAMEEDRTALEEDRAAMEEERTALEEDRTALEEDRTALEENTSAMEEDRTAMEEDRTALEEDRTAMEEDRTVIEEDRTAMEKDRTALGEDRTALGEDRTAVEEDKTALEENALPEPGDGSPDTDENQVPIAEPELSESVTKGDELGEETVTTETSDHAHTDTASSTAAPAEAPEADGGKSKALSTNDGGVQTGPTQEKKIPPAIKPKPGSFHLLKHKRVSGEYVISAVTKHVNPASDCSENEDPATKELVGAIEELSIPPPPPFPPPPPPPMLQKEREAPAGAPEQDLGPQETSSPGDDIIRSTAKEQPVEMSLEKLASFAAPKPYVPVKPSRFAQTVSSAARKRAEFFAPLYRSLSQPPGSFMSEAEAEERSNGRAPELQGTDDPGCGSDSRSSPQRTGLRDPGETPAMHGDAEPCTVQVIDLHTVSTNTMWLSAVCLLPYFN
ncbi:hypothetical protein JZ751_027657 [Albula glossodonta]|uniref:Cordon-bleu ubiquitin-like domain-containing protein n=1 Tax=Albula glossodonta TaxID=121402 RepID=A0A8T2P9A9_9TELE|nr:hypothetical protein JZ751_027657 [Albula glossodonta]